MQRQSWGGLFSKQETLIPWQCSITLTLFLLETVITSTSIAWADGYWCTNSDTVFHYAAAAADLHTDGLQKKKKKDSFRAWTNATYLSMKHYWSLGRFSQLASFQVSVVLGFLVCWKSYCRTVISDRVAWHGFYLLWLKYLYCYLMVIKQQM